MTPAPPPHLAPLMAPPPPRRRPWLLWVAIPTVLIVVTAVVVYALTKSGASGTEVLAEPIRTSGTNPFMPPAGDDQQNVTAPATLPTGQPVAGSPSAYSGDTHGLYGGTLNNSSCNSEAMISFLTSHPAEGAAWAGVQGISQADLPGYIRSLTPVVLRTDTAVTNHGFSNGAATTLHSVLQAGTAVLVDDHGVPRARCYCGNPLTPSARFTDESYTGPVWPSFTPQRIFTVQPAPTAITVFVLVDPVTNIVINRPAGTDGEQDQLSTADLANADISGTYTVTYSVNSCTYTDCSVHLQPLRIDCAADICTLYGPSDGEWSHPHQLTRNGSIWKTSGVDETAATCNKQPIPGATIAMTLSVDSSTVSNGRLKARTLRGTYLISSPAQDVCKANTASIAITLSAA